MRTFSLFKTLALALHCAALAVAAIPAQAGDIKGHAGTTFVLTPVTVDSTGRPTKYTHTVDGRPHFRARQLHLPCGCYHHATRS